jgi:hypothetical protein
VALLSHEGERTPPSLLRMFVEGRMIEALPLAPSVWPLGMDAAVTWTEGLQPRFDYDGIERNEGLNRALLGVLHIALGLANRVAIDLARVSPAQRAGVEAMLRGAVSAWTVVPAALGYAERAEASLGTEHEALYSAPIFPTIEPERRTSLRELAAYAARTRIVCVVPSWRARSASPAPDGRPVLVASAEEQARIVQALGGSLTLARYEAPEHSVDDAPSRRAALARALGEVARGGPVLWYERQGLIAAAMPAPTAITLEAHRGVVLARTERKKAQAPVMFAFDDPRTIPCSDWNGVAWAPPRRFAAYGQTLCKKLLAALCGDTAAQQQLGGRVDPDAPGVAALMIEWALALRRRRKRAAANAAMLKSLEQLPLLIWLDENGAPARVSLAEVEQRHGDAPPLLAAGVGFETLDWAPLVARSAREKSALARRFPRAFPAEHEIEERRSMAMRRAKKRVLMLQPAIALDDLSGYALAGEPSVRLPAEEDAKDGWNMDVIVALPTPGRPADAPWFSVCFEQRPVCTLSGRELGIPVVGRASSRDETDFEDLTGLTRSGRERVLARAGAAAERLALDKLGAAVRTRRAATVLSDPRALVLLTWLLEHRDAALLAARLMSDDFPWPTVQGEEAPWSSLARRDGELWFGRELFPKWRARAGLVTDLDRPVLAIPPGPAEGALVALLQRMGARLRDMSAPLAKLQAQRGASATSPRLIGAPAHPSMRASLGELGCTIGDGEAELVEGPESDVTVLLLGGAQARSALKLVVPLRAVLRVDATDEASLRAPLTAALGAAGRALVLRALAAFADPPRRVRQAARRLIREALSAHETCAPELAGVACYEDTAGHPLRLSDLVLKKRWSFTTREPPYPPGLTPLLCLSSDEVPALRTVVELVAADHQVDRASAAEKRRTARPLAEIALSDADRAHCLVTAPLVGENVRGEVGVLRPSFAGDRGCSLYVAGRPLSKFSDEPGFPVLASIDDASVEPDRWFEGPKHPSVVDGLRKRVRDGARVALQRVFAAPPSALAKRWLESEPCEMLEVTGQLWVSGESCAPAVRVHCAGQIAPVVRALKLEGASAALDPTLPLEGNLLVFGCADPERIFAALGRLGQRLVREMVAEACARGARSPALEELCASLALLGLDPSPPLVRACDGRAISYAELLAELENTGVLWLGDGRGSVEGAFPNALPPFVLPDDGSALLRVLARRAKPGSLRRVGEVAAAPVPPRPVSLSVPPVRAEPVVEEPAGNLWDRVRAAVAGDPTPDDPMPVAPELAPLARLLSSLALSGEPIARVLGGQGGRPTRYEAATKTLWVSTSHPVVAALLARPGDPEGLHALTAHALTEINRALVEVTDGEELRALLALLRET